MGGSLDREYEVRSTEYGDRIYSVEQPKRPYSVLDTQYSVLRSPFLQEVFYLGY